MGPLLETETKKRRNGLAEERRQQVRSTIGIEGGKECVSRSKCVFVCISRERKRK